MRTLTIGILTAALSLPFAFAVQQTTPAPSSKPAAKTETQPIAKNTKKHKKNHKKATPASAAKSSTATPATPAK